MHRTRRGFSLVELLAVIAILGVMAAIIGISMKPNQGSSLRAAQSSATSMFQAARTVASMRRTEARVIIYGGGSGADADSKYLRFMGVVYWDDPDGDGTGEWVAANSGVYLPQGVYYIPNSKEGISGAEGITNDSILASEDAPVVDLAYPVSTGTADTWYYYAFDGSGSAREQVSDEKKSFAGKTVVFASGHLGPSSGGDTPDIVIDNEFSTAGFVIRRIGGVLPVYEYDQVKEALK